MKKMMFIYNPQAGKEKIREHLSEIIEIFSEEGFDVTIIPTRKSGDVTELVVAHGSEYDYVVCSGGDGTMNEMATGMMQLEKKPMVGYIPAGTVNDFATTLRIPKNMPEAAKLVATGELFHCDVGRFNDRYFTYVAGFGAFTGVSYETPQELKNALGRTAYFVEALKQVALIKPHHMRIEYDDGIAEDDFILGLISNSESISGYRAYKKSDMKMDDGLFEAVFVKSLKNPLELQSVLNAFLTKKLDSDSMLTITTKHLHIISDDDIQWTLDGEDGGSYDEVDLVNEYRVLPIICSHDEVEELAIQIETKDEKEE